MQGHHLIEQGKLDRGFQIFQGIVNGKDTTYHSGAYVNMARCLLQNIMASKNLEGLKDREKEQQIQSYLDKALFYKPTNQMAFNLLYQFHFAYKRYVEAIDYLLKLQPSLVGEKISYLPLLASVKDERLIEALEKVYEKYPQHSEIGGTIGNMYMNIGDHPKAYYFLRKMLDKNREDHNALIGLSLACNFLRKA